MQSSINASPVVSLLQAHDEYGGIYFDGADIAAFGWYADTCIVANFIIWHHVDACSGCNLLFAFTTTVDYCCGWIELTAYICPSSVFFFFIPGS